MDTREGRAARRTRLRRRYFPETVIDDFSRIDNAVEFYVRVNSLITPEMTVVDFGAGRAQWFVDSRSEVRRTLRDFRGKARTVIGVDVDPVVQSNPSLDEAHVVQAGESLPIPDGSVDIIVADFTLEHISDPGFVSSELTRILRPGGWICARTPNKHGYIGLGARLVPNRLHARLVRVLQPSARRDEDVFPVRYRLNTVRDLELHFPSHTYRHIVYTMPTEPDYAGGSRVLWWFFTALQRFQPRAFLPMLCIFLQKRDDTAHYAAKGQPPAVPPQGPST